MKQNSQAQKGSIIRVIQTHFAPLLKKRIDVDLSAYSVRRSQAALININPSSEEEHIYQGL
jgi:hypothetical protein